MEKIFKNWQTILLTLVLGFAIGFSYAHWDLQAHCAFPGKHPGNMKHHLVKMFSKQLQLTPEQQTQVGAIFDSKKPQMIAIHQEMQPKFEAMRKSTNEEIKKVLNQDQQDKFDEMSQKWEAKMKEHRDRMFG